MEKMNVERFKRAVFNLLQTSYIENWDFVQKLDINYDKELDKFFLNVTFKDGLNKKEQEDLLDDSWLAIFNFFRVPVYLVNKSLNEIHNNLKEQREKKVSNKILQGFLDSLQIEGLCGYMLVDENKDKPEVILILDIDWLLKSELLTHHLASRLRWKVKQEIEKWLDMDVYIGSIAKKCDELD